MNKPRLFLHIGHPKTGTTSIQTFLLANRQTLRAQGVLYPETGLHDSAHRLISPAFYSAAALEDQAPLHMTRLLKEIAESGCRTVILSFEGFCGDNPACFTALRDRIDTTVIYYVRRQDHIAESRYAQHVRSFLMQEIRPAALAIRQKGFLPDYLRVLRLYEAVFGRDRLAVRVFEREALVGRDLITDFLHATGIAPSPAFVPSTSTNASLKRPYLAFKRHCNLLPFLNDEQKRLNKNLNDLSNADPAPSLGHILSPADRRALFESQENENAEVARVYLGRPDGILFHEPPPPPENPWEPLLPLTPGAQWGVFEKLSPENRSCIEFLHRAARLALPGDPLLPELPDANPALGDILLEKRTTRQFQRRLALLEQLAADPSNLAGRA
ncbi:MAG: hypothetical protein R6X19_03070 [Kiritimatiellia bacterium]